MSTDAVTSLRQRMIEDMNARKLGAALADKPHLKLQALRGISEAAPDSRCETAGKACGAILGG